MPERRKAQTDRRAAQAEPAGECQDCKKPAYRTADGKLRHDSRAADEGGELEGQRRTEDVKPRREHVLHRRIIG